MTWNPTSQRLRLLDPPNETRITVKTSCRNNILWFRWLFCNNGDEQTAAEPATLTPSVPSAPLGHASQLPAPYRRPTLSHSREQRSWAQPQVTPSPPTPPPPTTTPPGHPPGAPVSKRAWGTQPRLGLYNFMTEHFLLHLTINVMRRAVYRKKVILSINLHFHGGPDWSSRQVWQ